ncbi:hypothetical protein CQW23_25641 [Capsicum baccatum]|uniref:Uncharacterized protein n=1 Tax=Capsicum baccatum TaxID=33114 RepID=A0A2G2VLG4_CAPBA|nr:hypothetical protein CQW23_25641 [Capsicum baccatum]
MTCFNDRETLYPCLEIAGSKSDSHAKSLTLKVHPPMIDAFLLVRKPLETSLHLIEWSMTETKDVMDNFSSKIVTEKVLLLKSSTDQNGVIVSSPSHNGSLSSWCVPPSGFGEEKEVQIDDSNKLTNSWSDFFIGLRSNFITLRHDDDLIVEPYSPHRFSHQFGFCQDVPGILTKHYFDGLLIALVLLWDFCVRLESLSMLNIQMRPFDNGPFMTRDY